MEIEQIKELINCLESSKLSKLIYKKGDLELHLEKESVDVKFLPEKFISAKNATEDAFQSELSLQGERGGGRGIESAAVEGTFVTSPMVGTFYAASSPDQSSFVKAGDRVDAETVVCIIEAMKVMNEVKAGISGVVAEILASNGQPVEFGTRLLRII
jgi:acetyl-CoA carboxylase biotin carboxyl carrier protein